MSMFDATLVVDTFKFITNGFNNDIIPELSEMYSFILSAIRKTMTWLGTLHFSQKKWDSILQNAWIIIK